VYNFAIVMGVVRVRVNIPALHISWRQRPKTNDSGILDLNHQGPRETLKVFSVVIYGTKCLRELLKRLRSFNKPVYALEVDEWGTSQVCPDPVCRRSMPTNLEEDGMRSK
jgi:hypothetical protein